MKRCKYGDPTCPCQDGDQCHYVAVAGTPAMMISPHLVDRLIDLHNQEMSDNSKRASELSVAARASIQVQLKSTHLELHAARASLGAVRAYADGLGGGDGRTIPGLRPSDIARDLYRILERKGVE